MRGDKGFGLYSGCVEVLVAVGRDDNRRRIIA
jgi:hypothetical protein